MGKARKLWPVLVKRRADGSYWCADGACPFPVEGYNFARATKARIGWWVDKLDRWITHDREQFWLVRR